MCIAFGTVIVLLSGGTLVAGKLALDKVEGSVHKADLFGEPPPRYVSEESTITGPLNILLVGIDPRPERPGEAPRGDSVMVLHVPRSMDRAYLFSLPRDLLVQIPRWEPARFEGHRRDKLTHAMFYGASRSDGQPSDVASGFALMARTVSGYTGIKEFDAGAVINFSGFTKVVDALGGVTMDIDQRVESIHVTPDGQARWLLPGNPPRKTYEPGRQHLNGWQALDYVRQRYTEGGDYSRQRHQQQFIRAMVDQAVSKSVVTNPAKLSSVIEAAGASLTFDGRGRSIADFALALRGISPSDMTLVKLPGENVGSGYGYQGEQLLPIAAGFFEALNAGQIDEFIVGHPELVNK
ncbi:LCP family protein [Longispora albida]|uniref:LCP family protein n=1 Tax=Longispora albida TaxID=203523 RepID=UPI00037B4ADB|nr:LCP family protein [Longispora albida]